jgi:DNA replication initiation complex subunit (GINS family)
MSEDVTITYETLFELFRREKDRQELQKLWDTFVVDVCGFVKEQDKLLSEISDSEKKRAELHLDNVKRVIKELYEKREKKLVSMSLDRTRTRADIFDTSIMLESERELFNSLVGVLNNGRTTCLSQMVCSSKTSVPEVNTNVSTSESTVKKTKEEQSPSESQESSIPKKPVEESNEKPTKMIRFICAVPKFLGPNLEQYGPFEEEDVASLPTKVSDILITKERAEEMKESS